MKTTKSSSLFSFYTKILIPVSLLVFIVTGRLQGQNIVQLNKEYFYYYFEQKINLRLAPEKVLIKFKKNVNISKAKEYIASVKEFQSLDRDENLMPDNMLVIEVVKGVKVEDLARSVNELMNIDDIISVDVFKYSDEYNSFLAISNKVIVRLKSSEDYASLENVAKQNNISIIVQNEFDPLKYSLDIGKPNWRDAFDVANAIYETDLFEFSVPEFIFLAKRMCVSDPYFASQWALNNTGQSGGSTGADIDVCTAWQLSGYGNNSIKVAVIDEGVDLNHSDLTPNLLTGYDATGAGSAGGCSGNDSHGTGCAGIIAANNDNLGITGIAPDCKVIPVRIATSNNTSCSTSWDIYNSTWIANAINWSVNNGADILSNSWGGMTPEPSITTAINYAVNNGRNGDGAIVLFATGNNNSTTIAYPSSLSNVIAVGATSMCDERKSPTSCDGENWGGNYGVGLDVSAPGVKIATTDISGPFGMPNETCGSNSMLNNNNNYTSTFNGTSAACPMAAGVMALILSANPNLTQTQARYILETSCDKVGGYIYYSNVSGQPNGTWGNDLGYGRINAGNAVNKAFFLRWCPDYDFIITPSTSFLTHSSSIDLYEWIYYRVPVISGNTYTFKTCCGNGANATFPSVMFLLNNNCSEFTNGADQIVWTATYTGNVFLKILPTGNNSGFYTIAYKYTAPVQTCTVSVSPSSKTVSYPAGSATFSLTGSGNWTISESCPWITNVSPSSGNGNATITVTYLANGTLSSRSCTFTATCGSTTNNFTLNQNAASLTLSSPANGASGLSCTGINFSWSSNISNVVYRLQISTSNTWSASNGFNTTVYNQNLSSSTSFTWTGAQPNTTYYWCVKAYDATNQVSTDYTAYRPLYTGSCSSSCSLPITSILGPTLAGLYIHHGCAGNDLVITWTAQSDCNVIEYELAFTNSSGQIQVSELFTQPSFTYPIENNFQYNADLFFIVRSRNAAGWGPYTPLNQLRIFACQNNSCNDPYESNNSSSSSYLVQPVSFTNDEFYFKTNGACVDDAENDWDDYYSIDLPTGYYYTVVSRLHDSWDSDDGITYTGDMEYRYFDGSDWSDYEDYQHPTFEVIDGGSLYFRVRPYSNNTGNDGTYSLEVTIYRYLPNLKPYKPSGWDEPLIASISGGTHTNSVSFTTADNIYIDACQIEDSDAPCGGYNTYVYVDGDIVYITNSAGLQPYDYEWVEDISVGPLSAGWHEIKMVVDYGLNIEESNENDNEYVKSIYVSPASPDLLQYTPNGWSAPLVTSVTTETNTDAAIIYSTNNVYVDAAFSNVSNQNITNSFVSYLYLNNSLVYTFNTPSLNANNYAYANDVNIGELQPGTYELKMIVDGNGQVIETNEGNNIYIKNFTVVCNSPAQPSAINGNTTVCQSSTQTYSVTNVSGVTYTWSVIGGAVTSGQGTNSVNIVFTSSGAKTITVTPTINCGSGTSRTQTVNVTGFPAQPSVITGNTTVCIGGGTQTYSVTNVGGVTYNWSVSGGTFTGSSNTIIVTWNTAGLQSIIVTPSNSCGNGTSRSLTVTINNTPASVTISGGGTFCSSATLTASGGGGCTIYWQGTTSNGTSTATASSSQIVTSSGTYYYRAYNSCGWGTQGSTTVTINPPPAQPGAIAGSTSVCQGQPSVTYTVPPIANATSYVWTIPNGASGTSTTNSITVDFGSSATSGNISVRGVNSCGEGAISTLSITVNSIPQEPVLLSQNISFCPYGEKTLSVSTAGNVSDYTWILPNTFNGFSNSDSISLIYSPYYQIYNNTNILVFVVSTIYVIANNICGSSTPLSIYPHFFQNPPLMGMIMGDTLLCQGQNSITYTAPFIIDSTTVHIMSSPINQELNDYSNDTISYIWTLPNGWTGNSSTNSITCTPGSSGGTITLTAFNACGASIQRSIDVNVITVPPQPGTISGNTSVCPGSSQTYSVTNDSGVTYNWSFPTGFTQTAGGTTNSITVTAGSGNGNITVTPSNSCGYGTARTLAVSTSSAPTVVTSTIPANITLNCQDEIPAPANVQFVDACNANITINFVEVNTKGTTPNTYAYDNYMITRTWSASDASGNSSPIITQTIEVKDLTAPQIVASTLPADVTLSCYEEIPPVAMVMFTDNCSTPSMTYNQTSTFVNNPANINYYNYLITRTWYATDASGNVSPTITQVITVTDAPSLNLYIDQAAAPNNVINVTTDQDAKFYIKVEACADLTRRVQIQFQVYKDGVQLTDLGQYLTDQYNSVSYFTAQNGITNPNPSNTYYNPITTGTFPFANTAQYPPFNGYFVNLTTNSYNWFYMHFFNNRFITVDINAFSQPGQYTIMYNLVGANASCNITDNSTNYTTGLSYGGSGFQFCNNTTVLASNTMTINVSDAPIFEEFTIQTTSNPSIGGTTTGSGVFLYNTTRTVTAIANNGYTFNNWTENGNVVSNNTTYSFVLTNHKNLVANFICNLPLPATAGSINGPNSVCQFDDSVIFTVPLIANATSYVWTLPDGASGISSTNSISVSFSIASTSAYVTVKGVNSCGEGAVSTRSILIKPMVIISGPISGPEIVCKGQTSVVYSVQEGPVFGYYDWVLPSGASGSSSSSSITVNFSNSATSGEIKVNGRNYCGDGPTITKAITVNSLPAAAGSITGNTNPYQGTTGLIYSVPNINGITYTWTVPTPDFDTGTP